MKKNRAQSSTFMIIEIVETISMENRARFYFLDKFFFISSYDREIRILVNCGWLFT